MANRSVIVSFITKLNSKGLKQAESQFNKLGKSALAMGKATKLGFLLSGTGAVYFAQKQMSLALKAVMDEEKALASLQQTLKNVGSSFSAVQVDQFVQSLQSAFAVSEDQLRPALQQLITTTGDVTSAQELLKIALDVSKGSGKDLATVTASLSRAFTGNLGALGRLNVGLDKTLLKSGDLDGAIAQLSEKFSGQAAVAAGTMAGQMDALRISVEKAQENLGGGLVEALKVLSGDQKGGFASLGSKLEELGTRFGDVAIGLGAFVRRFKEILKPLAGLALLLTPIGKVLIGLDFIFGRLEKSGKKIREQRAQLAETMGIEKSRDAAAAGRVIIDAKSKKQTAEQIALQKKLQEQEKKLNAEKAKERAKKAEEARQDKIKSDLAAKFDIDNAQLAAAKRFGIEKNLDEETMTRIQALQAIRTEGYKDDETALNKLIQLDKMRAAAIAAETAALNKLKVEIPVFYVTQSGVEIPMPPTGAMTAPKPFPSVAPGRATDFGLPPVPMTAQDFDTALGLSGATSPIINVNVEGSVLSEQDLRTTIETLFFQSQRSGTNTTLTNLGR